MVFRKGTDARSKREAIERKRQAVRRIDEAMRQAKRDQDRAFAEEIGRWKDRAGA